jgi:hypothetical protein
LGNNWKDKWNGVPKELLHVHGHIT